MPGHLPGQRTGYTATPRDIFYARGGEVYLPGPCVLDGTNAYDGKNTSKTDEIRAGMVLAQITATKKWVPCRRTTVAAGGSGSGSGAGSAVIPVTDSRAFKSGESITIEGTNSGTVTRTISSIDYDNDLITVSGAVLQYNTGAAVYAATGGSLAGAEIPRGILAQTVRTLSSEPFNTTNYDKECVVLAAGFMNVAYLLGDYAACRDATTNHLGQFLWSDRQANAS